MTNRRRFIQRIAGATAGTVLAGAALLDARQGQRRTVSIGGKRIRTIDIHCHCVIAGILDVIKDPKTLAAAKEEIHRPFPNGLGPERLRYMDQGGIDIQALSINEFWYKWDRPTVSAVVDVQNQGLAKYCAEHSDRFVPMASVALQFPDLAAQQLDTAVRKLGMHAVAIGGSIDGEEISGEKFYPFWSKAEELGALVYMHPQPAAGTTVSKRTTGKGRLENIIGNPLETTVFLSHMIFDGTLDRFPGLRICASHGAGYLGSYNSRSDALCARESGADCRALKKKPGEYLRREIFADTIVFDNEALRHLVAECGVGQIMYGTDYPFDWPVGVDFILNAPFLSAADKTAILGGNAARMLKLPL